MNGESSSSDPSEQTRLVEAGKFPMDYSAEQAGNRVADHHTSSRVPDRIAEFEIRGKLGKGGFGVVY